MYTWPLQVNSSLHLTLSEAYIWSLKSWVWIATWRLFPEPSMIDYLKEHEKKNFDFKKTHLDICREFRKEAADSLKGRTVEYANIQKKKNQITKFEFRWRRVHFTQFYLWLRRNQPHQCCEAEDLNWWAVTHLWHAKGVKMNRKEQANRPFFVFLSSYSTFNYRLNFWPQCRFGSKVRAVNQNVLRTNYNWRLHWSINTLYLKSSIIFIPFCFRYNRKKVGTIKRIISRVFIYFNLFHFFPLYSDKKVNLCSQSCKLKKLICVVSYNRSIFNFNVMGTETFA